MILGPFQHWIFPLPHPQLYRLWWIKVCSVGFSLNFANYDISGCIPWLFNNSFCHFAHYHICFNVGIGYNHGSLHKWVVHTTCPDRFLGPEGPVSSGCVSVTVTAHHNSTQIERHVIPAEYLTAAPPRGKDQKCLILKGKMAGQVHCVKLCKTRQQPPMVILYNGTSLPLSDTCLVIEACT